jgi:mannosyltransferase
MRGPALWVVAVVLVGVWLRCSQVHESLWVDELHTSWVVADGAGRIAERARIGNQSPLYFQLVWGVVQLGGHHEWALRLISLVAGSGLVVAVYALVRRWSGNAAAGLFAALLVALHRDCVFYAQEARPYALLQLSAVVHSALFVELLRRPTAARRAMLVAGAAWLFYLHYTSFLFLLAEASCLTLWWLWGKPPTPYRPRAAALDAAVIGALIAPASQHVLEIARLRENWSSIVAMWPSTGLQIDFCVLVLLPFVGLIIGLCLRLRRADSCWHWPSRTWTCCWLALPPLLALLSTWTGLAALAMVRYLVISLVGAIVFAALCQASLASRVYRVVLSAAVIVSLVATSGMVEQWRYDGRWIGDRREAWHELVRWLNDRWPADRLPVFVCPGLLEDAALAEDASPELQQYCLFPVQGIYQLHAGPLIPLPTLPDVAVAPETRRLVDEHGGAWVIIRARQHTAELVTHALSAQLAVRAVDTWEFGTLTVVRLARQ